MLANIGHLIRLPRSWVLCKVQPAAVNWLQGNIQVAVEREDGSLQEAGVVKANFCIESGSARKEPHVRVVVRLLSIIEALGLTTAS